MNDIIMNMFIFFFISFSLLYTFKDSIPKKIDVNLPESSNAVSYEETGVISIELRPDGSVRVDGRETLAADIGMMLKDILTKTPDASVVLYADKACSFSSVVSVLDELEGIGVHKASVAALDK